MNTRTQLFVLTASAIGWWMIVEGTLRISNVHYDSTFFIPDDKLGWSLRPDAAGWQVTEGRQFIVLNNAGFRDLPRSIQKPSGTYRIAVLGNSWTEAMQVPLDRTFCSLLERSLHFRCSSSKNVEVLNFGVSGYSTAQELIQLRSRVWRYHPDVVLLAFYTARDVLNNLRELNSAATPEQSPYFVKAHDAVVLDASFQKAIASGRLNRLTQDFQFAMAKHLRTYEALNHLLRLGKIQVARLDQTRRQNKTSLGNLENAIYGEPNSPEVRKAWSITEAILTEMAKEVCSHDARFWIVTLANRAQVEFNPVRRAQMTADKHGADIDYADRRIQALGAREQIPVTSLAEPLRRFAAEHRVYLNGFVNTAPGEGHWNVLGHQVAAEEMATAFCDLFRPENQPDLRKANIRQNKDEGNVSSHAN